MMPAWIGVALAAIAMVEASRLAAQEPAPAKPQAPAEGDKSVAVSSEEYDGWKVFHSNCDRCHGQDATGSSFAPSLRASIGENGMSGATFTSVVSDGRPDKGMPAFKSTLTDAQVDQLYAYLKARSAGTLGPGRPKRSS
jgi:mono/diheme cytochrome c family protein